MIIQCWGMVTSLREWSARVVHLGLFVYLSVHVIQRLFLQST